jgi:hypothetical protein
MHKDAQDERDSMLLDAFKEHLHRLDDLRLVPHNDPHVLRLKQHLRTKIRELEQKLSTESCRKAAA